MALSTKAQAIYDRLVETDAVNEWVGIAKDYITKKGQYEPGPDYNCDVEGLREELKADADLSDASEDASNDNWSRERTQPHGGLLCQRTLDSVKPEL